MKKLFLFLFIAVASITFTSCSDDDSADNDSIVGRWELSKLVVNDIPVPASFFECEVKGIIEFKSDGTFTAEEYGENAQEECVLEGTVEGTWTNKGNDVYESTVEGETASEEITFEGSTFYFTIEEDSIIIKFVYKRV